MDGEVEADPLAEPSEVVLRVHESIIEIRPSFYNIEVT